MSKSNMPRHCIHVSNYKWINHLHKPLQYPQPLTEVSLFRVPTSLEQEACSSFWAVRIGFFSPIAWNFLHYGYMLKSSEFLLAARLECYQCIAEEGLAWRGELLTSSIHPPNLNVHLQNILIKQILSPSITHWPW